MSELLRVEGLSKRFGGVQALSDVSFSVAEGEILGLMGANGAGKTTAFSLIAGNQRPSAGTIHLDGQRIDGLRCDRVNQLGVARTFQIVRPFGGMSVLENVTVAALYGRRRISGFEEAEAVAREVLVEAHLADKAEIAAASLTLAGRKRLEVARALATDPRILLLDEVLAGLTASEVVEALEMVREIQVSRGLTLIVIEHVMRALMRLCGRIVVLHHGQKIAEGPPEQVAEDPVVIEAYFGAQPA